MSTTELRKRLIAKIQRSRRPELLMEVYRLMGTDTDDLEPFKLSADQRSSVAKGLKDAKAGKVIPAAAADKAIDAWLSK